VKGDPKVIAVLQQVLKAELTAINQYFLHSEMCENWGYYKLAGLAKKESIEEMGHAEVLIERILLLDGTPNMSDYFKINIGQDVKAQLHNDLQLEYDAVKRLNEGIKLCSTRSFPTRSITLTGWKASSTPLTRSASRTTFRSSCTAGRKRKINRAPPLQSNEGCRISRCPGRPEFSTHLAAVWPAPFWWSLPSKLIL